MKRDMTHDEAFAELDAIALDLLDGPERNAVLDHVTQCEVCRAELGVRRTTVADLAFAAPLATDSETGSRARIRERLTSRAASEQPQKPTATPFVILPPAESKPESRFGAPIWVAVTTGIVLVMALGLLAATIRERSLWDDEIRSQRAAAASAQQRADSLSTLLANRESAIDVLAGRDLTAMTLTSSALKDAYARVYWDRTRGSLTMIARQVPDLKPGRTYQLWVVAGKTRVSAGTFVPRDGEAVLSAQLSLVDPLTAIVVTEEPIGGAPQPTGPAILGASR